MSVLVTGASGFIGAHLVRHLCESGVRVRCLVRPTSRTESLRTLPCQLVTGALQDPDSLAPAVRGVNVIYHLAGATRAKDRHGFMEANEAGTSHLLAATLKHAPDLRRFVLVSSLAAVGPSRDGTPLDETASPSPLSVYGESKRRGEEAAERFFDRLPVAVVRPPVVYGPREKDVFEFVKLVARHLKPSIGFGERLLSFVHVDDLVRAMIVCGTHPQAAGRMFFATSGPPLRWTEVVAAIQKALGTWALTVPVPETAVKAAAFVSETLTKLVGASTIFNRDKAREMCARHWICDGSYLERELGHRSSVDFEAGMRSTVAWYRRQGWL